jgi:Flp pilus assembly protein TadD
MSLLLDALKKAAQEKQSTSSADVAIETEAVALERTTDWARADNITIHDEVEKPEELELPDETIKLSEVTDDITHSDFDTTSYDETQDHFRTPTPSTVTDEALQLLIHKTNHAHKKSRIITWGGIFVASLILLAAGGLYFYFDMMAEIEVMQRKHQIALANLKSKTKIEENLTSLAVAPEAENQVNKVYDTERSRAKALGSQRKRIPESSAAETARQNFSVQSAQKRDPISEALQRGWAAYHNKDYELSSIEYRKVLDQEPKNHDALLGLAAVSLQLDDMDKAREIYIQLLELDPRDPHAHAGLANIAQKSGSELSETKLKQLIDYRPDDAHLQFALGNLYIQKKSWPEAQQAFFNAWKADNQNPDYAYNLAVSLDHLGKHEAARSYYEDSLKLAVGKNISFSADAVKSRLAYLGAIQ